MKKPILIVLLILFIDQFVKIWVKTHMAIGDSIPVIDNFFYIHFVENEGMAFGWKLFGGGGFGKTFLTLFRLAAVSGIGYYLYLIVKQKKHPLFIFSISLVLAGALGNIIDSLFYGLIFNASDFYHIASLFPQDGGYAAFLHGKVVDMFYFPIYEGYYPKWVPIIGGDYFQFFQPVFNIADASISIGVVLLIFMQKKFFKSVEPEYAAEDEDSELIP